MSAFDELWIEVEPDAVEDVTSFPHSVEMLKSWLLRGWDARGQVTPDLPMQEAIARAIYDVDPWFERGERRLTFEQATEQSKDRGAALKAAAILALFNEKGNE